jgi:HEAT repeat protein
MRIFRRNIERLQARKDIQGLGKALKDPDPADRVRAVRALASIGGSQAVEQLIAALTDPSDEVWNEAREALEHTGPLALVPLIAALKDSNSSTIRQSAAWVLGDIGDEQAIDALIGSLQDQNGIVRFNAVKALVKINAARAVEPLVAALNDEDSDVRLIARVELEGIGLPAMPALIAALGDTAPNARIQAAYALAELGEKFVGTPSVDSSVEPLIASLSDPERVVRQNATWALARIADKRATGPLIACLSDSFEKVRQNAAWGLGRIESPEAVDVLLIALRRDQHVPVRVNAATSLGHIGDPRALPALAVAKMDANEEVRKAAAAAWENLKAVAAELPPESIPQAELLAQIEDAQQAESLLLALSEAYPNALADIVRSLEQLGEQLTTGELQLRVVEALNKPVFEWSGNDFMGKDSVCLDQVRADHRGAIAWFKAQDFAPLPTSMGEEFVAEYCFDMAFQAQSSGNLQEAWAGYHQALERFLNLNLEKMTAMTCWRLGQVYGARKQFDLGSLFLTQSAYLSKKLGNEQGYAWALYCLGQVFEDQGSRTLTKYVWTEALSRLQRISPDDASKLEKEIARIQEGNTH